jgi:TPR repeat protein/V8-like Glu-specific endopeptidase
MLGAGRPQNRPAAELFLRQACDGAEATGCLALGLLFRSTKTSDVLAEGTLILGRACRLGSLEACAEEAEAVADGNNNADGNQQAANILRRAACDKGRASACFALGSALVGSDDPPTRAEGLSVLEPLCRAGDAVACGRIVTSLEREDAPANALALEILDLGCRAGTPYMCEDLGKLLFVQASGPPEGRTAALAAFDRACAISDGYCNAAADIRARPGLAESCQRGEQVDCVALGQIYASSGSPLHSPAEALQLFGGACEAGQVEACRSAVEALEPNSPDEAARELHWLDLGCSGGQDGDCHKLGEDLLAGKYFGPDKTRGYAALALACERGWTDSCETLDIYALSDPDVPMVTVDARYEPPLTPEEKAEIDRRKREADELEEAQRCRTSEVLIRGVVYRDRICDRSVVYIIRGRLALAGEAPWQALIWRPERMNGRKLTTEQRVECGGALIREGWVLTAAHCVLNEKGRPLLTAGYQVRLGVLDASRLDGVNFGIRRVYVHDKYDRPSRTFDIALVELETRRRLRIGAPHPIKPIRIEGTTIGQRAPRAGAPVYVYGWGNTAFEGQSSKLLKAAKLALEDGAKCESDNGLSGYLKGSLLCAKAADRAQACDGDSGGPLISYDGVATVIGVVSAGKECGRRGDATRYTRVSAMTDWINKVLAGQVDPITPR